jgi:hypothetical protein
MKSIDKLAWIELQNKSILYKSFGKTNYIPGGRKMKQMPKNVKRNSRRANRTT